MTLLQEELCRMGSANRVTEEVQWKFHKRCVDYYLYEFFRRLSEEFMAEVKRKTHSGSLSLYRRVTAHDEDWDRCPNSAGWVYWKHEFDRLAAVYGFETTLYNGEGIAIGETDRCSNFYPEFLVRFSITFDGSRDGIH